MTGPRTQRLVAVGVLVLTVVQLAAGAFVPGLEQFEGKAFGARLLAYPVMMLAVPAVWWWRNRDRDTPPPWTAFSLVMAPFLVVFDYPGQRIAFVPRDRMQVSSGCD